MSSALPVIAVPRLLLWRHGRTEWNATGRFQGQLDPPLDQVGRDQAVAAALHLAAAGLPREDTLVVSSDLSRAVDTAATLTGVLGVPLRLDARLREHGMGVWEGLTRDEVGERYPDQLADWMAGREVRGRGGEDPGAVADRAVAALAELPPARVAVVVTHGGTAGRLMERLLGIDPDHRRVLGPLANCAWSELSLSGGHWRLIRHNSSARPLPTPTTNGAADRSPALRAASGLPDDETPGVAQAEPMTDADALN